jgi:hypothetical protein
MATWVVIGVILVAGFFVARCLCRRIDVLQARVDRLEGATDGLQSATEVQNERIKSDSDKDLTATFLEARRAETENCLHGTDPRPLRPEGT